MAEWRGREIAGSDKTASPAGHRLAGDETDLERVGFVLLQKTAKRMDLI
ncbi:MAG: hypothetical protein MUO80_05790 [Dehalococcoidia bacterium]|nr:hypothetical protein [Dehalococcoidia bacterium]